MSVNTILKQKGRTVISINPDAVLCDCLKLINEKRIGSLPVMDKKGNLHGLVSERDVLRAVYKAKGEVCDVPVTKIMTPRNKLVVASRNSSVKELMEVMTSNRVRHIPIMDGEKVIGIVSIGDVVKGLLDEVMTENRQMQDYISGRYV